ncbi:hypothetical protein MMC25_004112 [Agyrium rufum]|nr:hypothetical protein [Agyrium rufum]
MSAPILLILGYGSHVGVALARSFANKGYRIATTARSAAKPSEESKDYLHVQADLSDITSVPSVFEEIKKKLGAPPSVVVYNGDISLLFPPSPTIPADQVSFHSSAAVGSRSPDPSNIWALSPADLTKDLNVNVVSVFAAIAESIKGFATLPSSSSKTFIYTGNRLNIAPLPPLLSNGMGKAAAAHLVHYASMTTGETGNQFYYADERKADGGPAYGAWDADAHAEFYTELAERETAGPWLATFVKGKGYVQFH